jgi:hypothetical protein
MLPERRQQHRATIIQQEAAMQHSQQRLFNHMLESQAAGLPVATAQPHKLALDRRNKEKGNATCCASARLDAASHWGQVPV